MTVSTMALSVSTHIAREQFNGVQFIDERVATFEDASGAFTYYLLKENFSVAGTANADGSGLERLDYSATGSFAGSGGSGGVDVDYNDDGRVDADDLAVFQACASGPAIPQTDPACADMRLDADADVDQADFGVFQRCWSGNGTPAAPECTGAGGGPGPGGGRPASGTFVLHGRPADVLPDGHTLLFVRARFYDLKHGRWLQRDPTGFADGPNLYESFRSNAARYTDPKGLDSIETGGEGDLVYKGDAGFIWMFARNVSPDLVLIDHPDWPYAFIVKRRFAISAFQRSWLGALWYGDRFSHPLEIMQYATALASRSGAQANIVKMFDKHAPTLGWIDPGEVTTGARAEAYHALAQGGLQQMVGEVGALTQTAFMVTTGALAAPTGAGGVIVDVVSTGTDVATGKASVGTGAVVVIAAAGGTLLHLRFADDAIGPVTPRPTKPAALGRGSTIDPAKGRFAARNLREQLAIEQAMSNPAAGRQLTRIQMTDPRWPASEGWVKMQQMIKSGGDSINVHYVYNPITGAIDDFKIVVEDAR